MRPCIGLPFVVLAFEMPVPFYWLVLHGGVEFWRKRIAAGYLCAVAVAWGGGGCLLYHFRAQLFRDPIDSAPLGRAAALGDRGLDCC